MALLLLLSSAAPGPRPAMRPAPDLALAGTQKMSQPADVLTANAPRIHRGERRKIPYGWYGGATPQPQCGTGACCTTSAPGWELCMASRVPHSR